MPDETPNDARELSDEELDKVSGAGEKKPKRRPIPLRKNYDCEEEYQMALRSWHKEVQAILGWYKGEKL